MSYMYGEMDYNVQPLYLMPLTAFEAWSPVACDSPHRAARRHPTFPSRPRRDAGMSPPRVPRSQRPGPGLGA